MRHPMVDDEAALLALTNLSTITFHRWPSRADRLEEPDLLVIDLDPSTSDLEEVRRAARWTREVLDELDLAAYVQATGSRGIHVVTPLDRTSTTTEVATFADGMARLLAARHPDELTVEFSKAARGDRLYLDTARNGYAQTVVAPYSVRARRGAPVATPLEWDELDAPGPPTRRLDDRHDARPSRRAWRPVGRDGPPRQGSRPPARAARRAARRSRGRRRLTSGGLEGEERALGGDTAAVLTDRAVAAHDAVARHDERHRVVGARRPDRPHGPSDGRRRRRRRRSSRSRRTGSPAGARARRGGTRAPAAGRRPGRTCGAGRRSSRRAGGPTSSRRRPPRRIRGLTSTARRPSTSSWPSSSNATRTSPAGRRRQQQRRRAGCRRCGRRRRAGRPGRRARRARRGAARAAAGARRGERRRPAPRPRRRVGDHVSAHLPVAASQVGDAVGRAAAGRGLAAVEHRRHLGVRQVGEVVGDHGAALLRRQRVERGAQAGGRRPASGRSSGRPAGPRPARARRLAARELVDRLAVGDRHQPPAHVAVGSQPRVRLQRRQERLGPGVLGVGRGEQRPAHPHHDRAVLLDDLLERTHQPHDVNVAARRGVRSPITARSRGP